MKKTLFVAAVVVLVLGLAGGASAQTATQLVNFTVASFQEITVGDASVALNINAWTGDNDDRDQATAPSTYSIRQNVGASRITAQVTSNMPGGTTLELQLTPNTKGISAGYVILTSIAANVVT